LTLIDAGPVVHLVTGIFTMSAAWFTIVVVSLLTGGEKDEKILREIDRIHGWRNYDPKRYSSNTFALVTAAIALAMMIWSAMPDPAFAKKEAAPAAVPAPAPAAVPAPAPAAVPAPAPAAVPAATEAVEAAAEAATGAATEAAAAATKAVEATTEAATEAAAAATEAATKAVEATTKAIETTTEAATKPTPSQQ
jgi:hypothetical protein